MLVGVHLGRVRIISRLPIREQGSMTKVLAFDTAAAACSVAVIDGDTVLAHESEICVRGHAERLVPMIQRVMRAAGMTFSDLDRLAATVGPGSFTGLRIGLACARSLALAADRPLVGITTLEAIAHATPEEARSDRTVLIALETKRDDFYFQIFDASLVPLCEPSSGNAEALFDALPDGQLLIGGDSTEKVLALLGARAKEATVSDDTIYCDAAVVARIAISREPLADPGQLVPLYLRPPDTTSPTKTDAQTR